MFKFIVNIFITVLIILTLVILYYLGLQIIFVAPIKSLCEKAVIGESYKSYEKEIGNEILKNKHVTMYTEKYRKITTHVYHLTLPYSHVHEIYECIISVDNQTNNIIKVEGINK